MLQLSFIRQNPELVKEKLAKKHFHNTDIINMLLDIDDQRRKIQTENEKISYEINSKSKTIGTLMQNKNTNEVATIKQEVVALKNDAQVLTQKLNTLENQQYDLLIQLPNLPADEVPTGKTAEQNIVIKISKIDHLYPTNGLPHWELCKKYNLIDFELGNKITGSGFPFYIGDGARLLRSLIQYFIDFNTQAGYTEYITPLMVNEHSALGTGQLPDKEGQMYYIKEDDFYLIPTAEVTLTNIYRDEIISTDALPIKLTGHTPCFRREAGSYGKDVRGLNRLHQFDKVEIVQIAEAEKSYETLKEMVNHVEALIQTLELPYRILKLCGGDMGFASALTYDFEVYSSAQQKWLEVSSVSNFETFQTNRLKIRTKNQEGKTILLHSLNGSSLALPRIIATILENYQNPNGITIPQVLRSYFGKTEIS